MKENKPKRKYTRRQPVEPKTFEPADVVPPAPPADEITGTITIDENVQEAEAKALFAKNPKVDRVQCPAYFFNRYTIGR